MVNFTLKDFNQNEQNNYHTRNGSELVNMFGTPHEKKLMKQIKKNHEEKGHIKAEDQKVRDSLVSKYFHNL
jgi:hypothetical protein